MANLFLRLNGIPGECTDSAYAGWTEVDSFEWGASRGADTNFTVVARAEGASAWTTFAALTGQTLSTATLEMTRSFGSGGRKIVMRFAFTGVVPLTVAYAAANGETAATLTLTFDFASVVQTTWTYNAAGGQSRVTSVTADFKNARFSKA